MRIAPAITTVALVITLSACADPEPDPITAYLSRLTSAGVEDVEENRADLILLGLATCDWAKEGKSEGEWLVLAEPSGVKITDAMAIWGLARDNLC